MGGIEGVEGQCGGEQVPRCNEGVGMFEGWEWLEAVKWLISGRRGGGLRPPPVVPPARGERCALERLGPHAVGSGCNWLRMWGLS